jgi:hypothetical protein
MKNGFSSIGEASTSVQCSSAMPVGSRSGAAPFSTGHRRIARGQLFSQGSRSIATDQHWRAALRGFRHRLTHLLVPNPHTPLCELRCDAAGGKCRLGKADEASDSSGSGSSVHVFVKKSEYVGLPDFHAEMEKVVPVVHGLADWRIDLQSMRLANLLAAGIQRLA